MRHVTDIGTWLSDNVMRKELFIVEHRSIRDEVQSLLEKRLGTWVSYEVLDNIRSRTELTSLMGALKGPETAMVFFGVG